MPTLSTEEYQFGDTGTLLNSDSTLPFVDISSVAGLDNAPVRSATHDMEGEDGGYIDSVFESMRTVTIEGTVYAEPDQLETFLDTLKADFAPSALPKPLYFGTDLEQRVVFGKSQGFNYQKDARRRLGMADFQVQIICEDPRIYTDNLLSQTATRATGSVSVSLNGNRQSPALITLTGSITNPTVTYTRTGTVFAFSSYTLGSGNSIVIDLNNRTVIENGTTSRRKQMTVTGSWYKLVPGNNTFNFGGTGSTATINVQTRSAWR